MPAPSVLYQFSDSARLPWILTSGELRAGRNMVGDYPDPDFIWATTDNRGSRTAAGGRQGYREGALCVVRFTLRTEDFERWPYLLIRYSGWTLDQQHRLERTAREDGDDPTTWWCRPTPLSLDHCMAIETKAYREPSWRPLADPISVARIEPGVLGVAIGNMLHCSRQVEHESGATAYEFQAVPYPAVA